MVKGEMMKNTSAIRRVDELGRVVIPKEIREELRIFTGSVVDIRLDSDKNIVISKGSRLKKVSDFANMCTRSLRDFPNLSVFLCDNDQILSVGNVPKSQFLGALVSLKLFEIFQRREIQIFQNPYLVPVAEGLPLQDNISSQGVFPISAHGDLCGGLVVCSTTFVSNFDFIRPIYNFLLDYLNE